MEAISFCARTSRACCLIRSAPLILIKENVCRSSYCREWREERNEAITPLKAEVAELKGKVDALLTLLGQRSFKAADVIDLSDWRKDNAA